jgi:hypothetical protein
MAWDVVRNLETCDLKVIAWSCDGASMNVSFEQEAANKDKESIQ